MRSKQASEPVPLATTINALGARIAEIERTVGKDGTETRIDVTKLIY